MKRPRLTALLVILVAWLTLFWPQLFAGRVFVLGDAAAFRPFSEFSRARWLAMHERTHWNPYVFAGIPSTASLADTRPQYLPDGLLNLSERVRRLPGWPPLATGLMAHLLGMLSAGFLVRALWGSGALGIATAGIAWGLMPNLIVPFAYGHDAQLVTAALMPAVLLLVHGVFASGTRLGVAAATVALAGVLGAQGLAGHPQILAYSGFLGVAFALERALWSRRPGRLWLMAAAIVGGAGLACAVWWPAYLYGAGSVRGGSGGIALAKVVRFSQAPRDLLSLFWPWAVGFAGPTYWGGLRQTDYPQYAGATICVLALWGWRRGADSSTQAAARLLVIAALAAAALSLGTRLGTVYSFLHASVPLLSRFRVAVAVMIVAQLALVLLAARGVDRLTARAPHEPPAPALRAGKKRKVDPVHARRRTWSQPAWIGAIAALAFLVGVLLAFGPLKELYVTKAVLARAEINRAMAEAAAVGAGLDLLLRALLIAGLAGALALYRRAGAIGRWAGAALVALVAVDLGLVGVPILGRATGTTAALEAPPPTPLSRVGAADSLARVLPLDEREFFSNAWVSWRARSIAGLHGAAPRRWEDLMDRGAMLRVSMMRTLAVRYVARDPKADFDSTLFDPVVRAGVTLPVMRLRLAPSRAYAVPRVLEAGDAATLDRLMVPDFDPVESTYVALRSDGDAAGPAFAGSYPGSRACRLRWIDDSPDRLELATAAPGPAFVVVADSYFPGWHGTIDGRPAAIHRVNYLVRGMSVPAGEHRLVMEYEPEGWILGGRVTRVALATWWIAALALGATWLFRRRNRSLQP